jgi:small-conductance mechanosensitive channel
LAVDETTASAALQALSDGSAGAAAASAAAADASAAASAVSSTDWWRTTAQPALVAGVLAAGTDPVVRTLWNATHLNTTKSDLSETVTFSVADSVTTSAKVYLALLGAQAVLGWVSAGLPNEDANTVQATQPSSGAPELLSSQSALTIALTVWVALSLSTLKRLVFLQSVSGTSLGRVALYDRLLDFILFLLSTLVILDVLHVDLTSSVQSLFTAGGVGALLFSLASRGLAEQIVGGFILNAWDDMEEGNDVILGDKTEGVVHRIGLVETEIMGYDNVITKLPNSQLTTQRIQNLSRVKQSRVKQTLRFKYKDLEVLPTVLAEMKEEIRRSCPKLIDDGTKGFSCLLQSYEPDHVSACVSCHFDIPPSSGEYSENRQQVLLAIARAMKNHGVEFALPAMTYETSRADQPRPQTWMPPSGADDAGENREGGFP